MGVERSCWFLRTRSLGLAYLQDAGTRICQEGRQTSSRRLVFGYALGPETCAYARVLV